MTRNTERLARHYGIPNVYGSSFRRVTVADETRLGLLGQGTILTATSRANRTSPVLRGKWVLENLLGAPPPPPPPTVPMTVLPPPQETTPIDRISAPNTPEIFRILPPLTESSRRSVTGVVSSKPGMIAK